MVTKVAKWLKTLPHAARRFLVRILQDTEDDLEDNTVVPIPDVDKRATLQDIRDNHLFHQALAINGLHIRVGRVEAKVGLIIALILGLLSLAAEPLLQEAIDYILGRL